MKKVSKKIYLFFIVILMMALKLIQKLNLYTVMELLAQKKVRSLTYIFYFIPYYQNA